MLLDKLFAEKLESKAEELRTKGWRWVKPPEGIQSKERFDYEHCKGSVPEHSNEQKTKIDTLQTEADAPVNNYDTMDEDETRKADDRYDEITALIESMQKPSIAMTIKYVAEFSSMSITAAIWLLKKALSIRLILHPPMKLLAMAALASRTIILLPWKRYRVKVYPKTSPMLTNPMPTCLIA